MNRLLVLLSFVVFVPAACTNAPAPEDADSERGMSTRGKADQPGSCEAPAGDFCGEQSADGCWCDDQCTGFGDCCSDRVEVCEAPEEIPGSCEGSCGGQSADGCWCDDQCAGFGDCCEDITEICEAAMPTACEGTPRYRVTLAMSWSGTGVPNPHWSPPIGGTHSAAADFWSVGGLASNGIEVMAETGGTGPLANEVNAAVGAGSASQVLQGPSISTADGSSTLTFETNADAPLLSLVSMMAPSPDWFVGVDSISLCPDGDWVGALSVDLEILDAGTDSGTNFTSADLDTNPASPVDHASRFIIGGQPATLGTMTIQRIQ